MRDIRSKSPAGEQMSDEVRKSRSTLHHQPADPLGYDTRDPLYPHQMAKDAVAKRHAADIEREIHDAMRRWRLR